MKKRIIVAVAVTATAAVAVAAAVAWTRRSFNRWRRADRIVRDLEMRCATPVSKLWAVADAMTAEMTAGLAVEGAGSLPMLLTPDLLLPTGDEKGVFFGLELDPTKVCLMWVQLEGKDSDIIRKGITEVPMPSSLMVSTSKELYDYIAVELEKFISAQNVTNEVQNERDMKIGISFPFPILSKANKMRVEWIKGFSIKEKDDHDAVEELNEAMKRHNIKLQPLLVNDCIGVLAGARFCSSDIVAAIILGMGTNASYVEPPHHIPKWQGSHASQREMIVNMEWGNFQSCHLPITDFDIQLEDGTRPDERIFEKLISGLYLGDIVRRVLLKIAEETKLFGHNVPAKLRLPLVLRTSDMASIHQDASQDLEVVGEKMRDCLGIPNTTLRMRELVVEVCDIIAKRAARLAMAGLVGILMKLGRHTADNKGIVVVAGELYEHYRLFRQYLHDGMKNMLQGRLFNNVVIDLYDGESGIGAALLAAANS